MVAVREIHSEALSLKGEQKPRRNHQKVIIEIENFDLIEVERETKKERRTQRAVDNEVVVKGALAGLAIAKSRNPN
jgi:hypothetical protein